MKQFGDIRNKHYNTGVAKNCRFRIFKNNRIEKAMVCVLLIFLSPIFLEAQDLDVMSFNILYSNAAPDNWDERRPLVVKTIFQDNPDIAGLQEVREHQFVELQSDLKAEYTLIMPRNKSYFGNAIAYRKTRFTEISSGRITYSPTPEIPGTDFHDNDNSRYASWVILNDKKSNRSVFVLNTHFFSPAEHTKERYWSAKIVMEKLQELAKGLPIIAMGDFNMEETHDAYIEIVEHPVSPLTDTYRALHPSNPDTEGTYHGHVHKYPGVTNEFRIDYIFSAHMNILESEILHTHFDEKYPSDHYPVTALFTYGEVPASDSK